MSRGRLRGQSRLGTETIVNSEKFKSHRQGDGALEVLFFFSNFILRLDRFDCRKGFDR